MRLERGSIIPTRGTPGTYRSVPRDSSFRLLRDGVSYWLRLTKLPAHRQPEIRFGDPQQSDREWPAGVLGNLIAVQSSCFYNISSNGGVHETLADHRSGRIGNFRRCRHRRLPHGRETAPESNRRGPGARQPLDGNQSQLDLGRTLRFEHRRPQRVACQPDLGSRAGRGRSRPP
jgi:hypothetical protein